ncbi:hypothetical protein BC827DRAFT_1156309 [Russula dissimulans]|nr:hypothetical protein BC827DRAFT_1156309 [Russula dissimulans]
MARPWLTCQLITSLASLLDYICIHPEVTAEDEEGILLALQHRDRRARRIRLEVLVESLQNLLVAIDDDFPTTSEYLYTGPPTAPHLRHLMLQNLAFPMRSPLITTSTGLVILSLNYISTVKRAFSHSETCPLPDALGDPSGQSTRDRLMSARIWEMVPGRGPRWNRAELELQAGQLAYLIRPQLYIIERFRIDVVNRSRIDELQESDGAAEQTCRGHIVSDDDGAGTSARSVDIASPVHDPYPTPQALKWYHAYSPAQGKKEGQRIHLQASRPETKVRKRDAPDD